MLRELLRSTVDGVYEGLGEEPGECERCGYAVYAPECPRCGCRRVRGR